MGYDLPRRGELMPRPRSRSRGVSSGGDWGKRMLRRRDFQQSRGFCGVQWGQLPSSVLSQGVTLSQALGNVDKPVLPSHISAAGVRGILVF